MRRGRSPAKSAGATRRVRWRWRRNCCVGNFWCRLSFNSYKDHRMFTSLKGRSVIVPGASKGIGRGLAQRFGLAGCKVLVVSRNLGEAKSAAADILAAGGTAQAFEADVTRQADMQAMARTAAESFGGIDILCAN